MTGGGAFHLDAGQWTDDTSMALCLGQSLLDCNGFNPIDQMGKYLKWYNNGYMSSNGRCFDIGNTVSTALSKYERTGDPYAGSTHERSAGNGSIMRLAPIPMYYLYDKDMLSYAGNSSKITHGHEDCVSACVVLAHMTKMSLTGHSKEEILSLPDCFVTDKIKNIIINQTYKHESEIVGSGYVVKSLEAALWAFYKGKSFKDCVLLAVNLGDDADSTGAITGQLAGAYYGYDSIPKGWKDKIAMHDLIYDMALKLYQFGTNNPN